MLRIEFTLTPDEVRTATLQAFRAAILKRLIVIWLALGALLELPLLLAATDVDPPSQLRGPAGLLLIAWLIGGPLGYLLRRWVRRPVAPLFLAPTVIEAGEETFSVSRPTFSGSGTWPYFLWWKELPESFALFGTANSMLIIPKRACSPEQLDALRVLLSLRVRAGGG